MQQIDKVTEILTLRQVDMKQTGDTHSISAAACAKLKNADASQPALIIEAYQVHRSKNEDPLRDPAVLSFSSFVLHYHRREDDMERTGVDLMWLRSLYDTLGPEGT